MNVTDYSRNVRFQLGLSATDQVLSDEVVLWALNGALQAISTDKDWPWLLTEQTYSTAAADATLSLPTNYTRTVSLTIDNRLVNPSSHIVIDSDDNTNTGRPAVYAVEANDIRVYPTPDAAYAVVHQHYRSEPELILPVDAPLLPDAYSEALVYEAAVKAAIRTNRLDRLQTLRDEAEKFRKRMTDNYVRTNKPGRIRRTKDSIWPAFYV